MAWSVSVRSRAPQRRPGVSVSPATAHRVVAHARPRLPRARATSQPAVEPLEPHAAEIERGVGHRIVGAWNRLAGLASAAVVPCPKEQHLPAGGGRARHHLPEVMQAARRAGIVPARDVQDGPVHPLVPGDGEPLPVRIDRRMVEGRLPVRIGPAQAGVELADLARSVHGTPVGDGRRLERAAGHAVEPLQVVLRPEGAVAVRPVTAPAPRTPRRHHGDEVRRAARRRGPLHPGHVGAPQHSDTAVAPRLARDPLHRVVAVLEVVDPGREEAVGIAAPPHVLDRHRVAVGRKVATPDDEVLTRVAVGGADQDRGRRTIGVGQVQIDGQAGSVPHHRPDVDRCAHGPRRRLPAPTGRTGLPPRDLDGSQTLTHNRLPNSTSTLRRLAPTAGG